MEKEKLFYRGLFFFLLKSYLIKVLECTDIWDPREQQKLCEIDNFPIKSSTRNMGYYNTGNKETNQEL